MSRPAEKSRRAVSCPEAVNTVIAQSRASFRKYLQNLVQRDREKQLRGAVGSSHVHSQPSANVFAAAASTAAVAMLPDFGDPALEDPALPPELWDPALEDPALNPEMCEQEESHNEEVLHTGFAGFDETDDQQPKQQRAGSSTGLVPRLRAAEQADPAEAGRLCSGRS